MKSICVVLCCVSIMLHVEVLVALFTKLWVVHNKLLLYWSRVHMADHIFDSDSQVKYYSVYNKEMTNSQVNGHIRKEWLIYKGQTKRELLGRNWNYHRRHIKKTFVLIRDWYIEKQTFRLIEWYYRQIYRQINLCADWMVPQINTY